MIVVCGCVRGLNWAPSSPGAGRGEATEPMDRSKVFRRRPQTSQLVTFVTVVS